MKVKNYMVYWKQSEEENGIDYIQAPYATYAVGWLGIPEDQVIEVAVVLEDWRKSKPRDKDLPF